MHINHFKKALVGLAGTAALALPTSAGADVQTAVSEVRAHTSHADRALDRAVELFERNAVREGRRAFAESRKEMGLAKAEAAKAKRRAEGQSERGEAASANRLLAEQQGENVDQLVGALDEVGGRAENAIAKAAVADTRGRDKALGVVGALVAEGTPAKAEKGLARAIEALSQSRDEEVAAEAKALAGDEISGRTAEVIADAVAANVEGQARAAKRIAELITSSEMPEQSKQGLQRAYDAITREQERSADVLNRFSDRMPERVRALVERVVRQARENAREMRENRPSPPSGQPEETPTDGLIEAAPVPIPVP